MPKMLSNIMQRMRKKIREQTDILYLRLSDCDGMCEHCAPVLKKICDWKKGNVQNGECGKLK